MCLLCEPYLTECLYLTSCYWPVIVQIICRKVLVCSNNASKLLALFFSNHFFFHFHQDCINCGCIQNLSFEQKHKRKITVFNLKIFIIPKFNGHLAIRTHMQPSKTQWETINIENSQNTKNIWLTERAAISQKVAAQ